MPRLLILFAHPRFEKSRANKILLKELDDRVSFHDLYERYPDFNIDLEYEKQLLLSHDIIIWHHPFYWYSCPPLLKQWIDIVLELGWAYGTGGVALKEKVIFNVLTSGGPREVYNHEGRNRHTINEFLAPFKQTALLCNMIYLPPFAVQGTHKLSDEELHEYNLQYRYLTLQLISGINTEALLKYDQLNDWISSSLKLPL